MLKGTWDITPLYKPLLEQAGPLTFVYGDAQSGVTEFREASAETPRMEVVAHVAQKMPIRPFTMFICGEPPKTMHVPARKTTVALWHQGHCEPGFDRMMTDLIQLNKEPPPANSNYAKLFRERVLDDQYGKFAMCLGYFSRHPRLVLATRNMELYTWLVYYNGVYLFMWSTDHKYLDRIKETLEPHKQNELFYLPVVLDTRSNLVLHPLFWVTKFEKVLKTIKVNNKLLIISYMRNYLLRMSLTQPTTNELDRHETGDQAPQ